MGRFGTGGMVEYAMLSLGSEKRLFQCVDILIDSTSQVGFELHLASLLCDTPNATLQNCFVSTNEVVKKIHNYVISSPQA